MPTFQLQRGVARRPVENAALATLLLGAALEQDVPVHAPGRTPAVLDLPVRLGLLLPRRCGRVSAHGRLAHRAKADGKHAVVQRGAARRRKDAALVELKALLVGLDGDAHGLLGQRGHESLLVGRHVSVLLHRRAGHVLDLLLARAVHPFVRVRLFRRQALVRLDEIKGVVHETAVAALVLLPVAVNQLLLRQHLELARLEEVRGAAEPTLRRISHSPPGCRSNPVHAPCKHGQDHPILHGSRRARWIDKYNSSNAGCRGACRAPKPDEWRHVHRHSFVHL